MKYNCANCKLLEQNSICSFWAFEIKNKENHVCSKFTKGEDMQNYIRLQGRPKPNFYGYKDGKANTVVEFSIEFGSPPKEIKCFLKNKDENLWKIFEEKNIIAIGSFTGSGIDVSQILTAEEYTQPQENIKPPKTKIKIIKEAIINKNISKKTLSKKSGISISHIDNVISERLKLTDKIWNKFCSALDINTDIAENHQDEDYIKYLESKNYTVLKFDHNIGRAPEDVDLCLLSRSGKIFTGYYDTTKEQWTERSVVSEKVKGWSEYKDKG